MFKDYTILEEILYYDGPLIYTCENEHGHFLGYSVDWTREPWSETTLFFKATPEELAPLLNGEITIRNFMKTHPVTYISIRDQDGIKPEQLIKDVPEDYIPKEGVRLRPEHDEWAIE